MTASQGLADQAIPRGWDAHRFDRIPPERLRTVQALARSRRHDWAGMRTLYVEGHDTPNGERISPTLGEVADEFGVHPARVRERAAREQWTAQRREFRESLHRERLAARDPVRLAIESTRLDEATATTALAGLDALARHIDDLEREQALHAAADRAGVESGMRSWLEWTNDLARLAEAAHRWYDLASRSLGMLPQPELPDQGNGATAPSTPPNPNGNLSALVRAVENAKRSDTASAVGTRLERLGPIEKRA